VNITFHIADLTDSNQRSVHIYSLILPICTVATSLRAMCKFCSRILQHDMHKLVKRVNFFFSSLAMSWLWMLFLLRISASEVVWKVKLSHVHSGSGKALRLPEFHDSRHMNMVRFSALRTGGLYSSGSTPSTYLCQNLRPTQSHVADRINLLKPTGHVMHQLWCNNCTLCPHYIYVFCIYLRTNSDLCHLQHKLIGLCNRDEKCLQRGTDWGFK